MTGQRGFTLVDLLVALSVSALLISLVYGVVVLAQRSALSVNDRAAQSEQMRIGWQFIDAAIARAEPVNDPVNEESPIGFVGMEDRLSFIADQPGFLGPGGLTRITLESRDTGGSQALVIIRERFTPNPREDEAAATPPQATLVDRLERFELAYFGSTDDDTEARWMARWEQRDTLPGLIEVRVKPADAPAWPILVSRPMAGSETAGLEDPEAPDGEPSPDERFEEPEDEDLEGLIDAPIDA